MQNGTIENRSAEHSNESSGWKVHDPNLLRELWENGYIRIPMYSILFLLCIIGNGFVILTLVRDKRMRTVTNVFLLNLAISDLLLGVFCIPFTLVGTLLREFIFGHVMCRLIPYLQAVSVAVSAWTLVAMSVERYYAICYPLRSRRWQTKSHAKKMICVVWIGSLLVMMPIATLSRLMALKDEGKFKCREMWPDLISEQAFTVMLDFLLLVVPLFIMIGTYCKIVQTLRNAMKSTPVVNDSVVTNKVNGSPYNNCNRNYVFRGVARPPTTCTAEQRFDFMRRTNADKALQQKKRIIVMLIVVVMEFFICWSPLYAINTISMFAPKVVYDGLGYTGLSLIQLLAHTSSISNPITYCFLNTKFRQSFISVICCWARKRRPLYSMSESTPTLKHNASKPPTARQLSHL